MNTNGLVTRQSAHSMTETASRFEAALDSKKVTLFACIDHAAGAQAAGMELRPTLLFIFGNPKVGTPLMQISQITGIDLPLKALIWQDADAKVWFTYNDVAWITERHEISSTDDAVIKSLANALDFFASAATEA